VIGGRLSNSEGGHKHQARDHTLARLFRTRPVRA
jgi:hypothetical protein